MSWATIMSIGRVSSWIPRRRCDCRLGQCTVIQDPDIQSMQTGHSSNTTRSFWFYPPIVGSLGLFESAARGDVPWDDELNLTPGYKKHLDRIERQRNER